MDGKNSITTNHQTNGEQLNKYCLQQISINLQKIESCLSEYKHNPEDTQSIIKIISLCDIIEDFAIVYGYDGVENLAFKINEAVATILTGKKAFSQLLFDKLQIAIHTIRSLSGIEDDKKVQSIMKTAFQDIKHPGEKSFDDIAHINSQLHSLPPEISTQTKTAPAASVVKEKTKFDIKEMNSINNLVQLLNKNMQSAKDEPIKHPKISIILAGEESKKAKEIEKVFNNIFIEETIENIENLNKSIISVKEGKSFGEGIMRIKEACGSLKEAANCFKVMDVQEPLDYLNQVAKVKLTFNKKPASEVLAIISKAGQALRQYIEQGDKNFNNLNNELKNILALPDDEDVPAVVATPPESHSDTPEITVINDVQLNQGTIQKKKVKVIMNDTDDRRWISKFK